MSRIFRSASALLLVVPLFAQSAPATKPAPAPAAPAVLPGKGLAEHDFLYAGEAKDRRAYIIKKGAIVWTYDNPQGKGEISDAVLLSNGNLLLAHQFAVKLVSPEKKVLWNLDAPAGTEIHTAQPIGKDHVVFVQNGDPALVRVFNVTTNTLVKEFPVPVKNPKSVHGHFRHARLTAAGTLLVTHMDLGKLAEYDYDGKEVWSLPAPGAWGANPLANGNILLTDKTGVHEITRAGKVVWEVTKKDLTGYTLANLQLAWRLPNGNTVLDNWVNQWTDSVNAASAPVQALEVTPEKKVVWALRSWTPPADLGPATTIQILDTPESPEKVTFGPIK